MGLITSSIKDQVYHMLKEEILKQEIKLGEQLNPRDIAEENEISVMPVRDALLRLVNQGLVINKPRVGFYVKEFSRVEIENIMEVRKMFESYCLENYFYSINREPLQEYLNKFINRFELGRQEFDIYDEKLHDLIINSSQNDYLISNYNKVRDIIIIFRHLDKDQIRTAHQEHIKLIKTIFEDNVKEAKIILEQHIERVANAII